MALKKQSGLTLMLSFVWMFYLCTYIKTPSHVYFMDLILMKLPLTSESLCLFCFSEKLLHCAMIYVVV